MRKDFSEEHDNSERWLVSYADFITLLFAFFVVMYAISSVNDDKYRILSQTLAQTFDANVTTPTIQIGEPTLAASPHIVDQIDETAHADEEDGDTWISEQSAAADKTLSAFADEQGVTVHADKDWLELSLDSNFLFQSGDSRLSITAQEFLTESLDLLTEFDNPITVEGYTDNIPTTSSRYPSNWELSADRALSFARYLIAQGVPPERLLVSGAAEFDPLDESDSEAAYRRNRRIELKFTSR